MAGVFMLEKISIKKIDQNVISILSGGGVGVLPTDTLYGLVASALDEKAVERVYELRKRTPSKPMIILIYSPGDLKKFGINVDFKKAGILEKVWPGKVSVVFDCELQKFVYLHRGKNTLAFRMPKPRWLRELLSQTGPLVAPSANFEGEKPARTIDEAKKYFSDSVDFYVDFGPLDSKPSTIIKFEGGGPRVLREGAVNFPKTSF